jgi:hypothetical protein
MMTVTPNTFTIADTGDNTVTLTVWDSAGNSASCTAIITVIPAEAVELSPKVLLQGPMNPGTGLMNDALRTSGYLPLTEPYTMMGYTHVGPGGGEMITNPLTVLSVTGPNAIVDWVFVQLRSGTSTIVATRSALIQRDGDVVEVNGVSPVSFTGVSPGNYHVVIQHRNHLSVMSLNPIALSSIPVTVSFADGSTPTWGSFAQVNNVLTGFSNAMWAGDANGDKIVTLTGVANDAFNIFFKVFTDPANPTFSQTHVVPGYFIEDLNVDGQVVLTGVQNDPFILNLNVVTHPLNTVFSQTYQIFDQLP